MIRDASAASKAAVIFPDFMDGLKPVPFEPQA
jgi:hypothetical protein